MAKFYPISYSGMKLYENCPYSFYRQKICEPKVKDTDLSPALERGIKIHKAMEDIVRKNKSIPAEYPQLVPIAGAIERLKKEVAGAKLEAERSLYIDREYKPVQYKNSFDNFFNSFINAKVDLTITVGDFAIIKDYKTGKTKGDRAQLDMQAGCLFANAPDLNTIKSQFVYVDTSSYSQPITHTRETVWTESLTNRISEYQYGLENDIFPKKQSDFGCRFCPVTDCQFNRKKR